MNKKAIKYIIVILMFIFCISITNIVYAADNKNTTNTTTKQNTTNESRTTLIELREKEAKSLDNYVEIYGSESYGLTAYILHKVQIFSIPLCFLGIIIGAVHKYVIGIRHLESNERGLALMVSFITIAIICQVLPLIFTIVVKFGRE